MSHRQISYVYGQGSWEIHMGRFFCDKIVVQQPFTLPKIDPFRRYSSKTYVFILLQFHYLLWFTLSLTRHNHRKVFEGYIYSCFIIQLLFTYDHNPWKILAVVRFFTTLFFRDSYIHLVWQYNWVLNTFYAVLKLRTILAKRFPP